MANPDNVDDMRRHALDLLSDHVADGDLAQLEDGEREAYIAYLAESLGTGMLRYIGFWILNDFPTVEEWRANP